MSNLPPAMMTGSRQPDQVFSPTERLYRRIPLEIWNDWDDDIELDAIELPDMSVMRSKYAHPEWTRFEGDDYKYDNWGVVGFQVADIPLSLLHAGTFAWSFNSVHDPLKKNYPHTEIRAYENGRHVSAEEHGQVEPDVYLRWRERLLRKVRKFVGPNQNVAVRVDAPSAS